MGNDHEAPTKAHCSMVGAWRCPPAGLHCGQVLPAQAQPRAPAWEGAHQGGVTPGQLNRCRQLDNYPYWLLGIFQEPQWGTEIPLVWEFQVLGEMMGREIKPRKWTEIKPRRWTERRRRTSEFQIEVLKKEPSYCSWTSELIRDFLTSLLCTTSKQNLCFI